MTILGYAQRIQALAQSGLAFSPDVFDQERYQELLAISYELMAAETKAPSTEFVRIYAEESGYATPKSDVRALIVNHQGAILMVEDRASQEWSLPGGFADVGLSATENIIKEVFEETGLHVTVERLLAVYDTNKTNPQNLPVQYYKLVFLCKAQSGQLETSYETSRLGYFQLGQLPRLSKRRNTSEQIAACYHLEAGAVILS